MSVSRRAVVATGVALPALAACANPSEDPTLTQVDRAEPGTFLVHAKDVPVGGCHVIAGAATVVTQPTEGEFRAFSGVCTHKHCFLASSPLGYIQCPCHGSRFDLNDGSVLQGPAEKALEEFDVDVTDGKVTLV
ncbi:Rieske (2Fe-2S) protein [Nocardioides yefusunii]|uniref:Cytochrome bc1 complex Rieske iron-sulfur subunit n=1 Tax=Nocardioides yefusunii TaxID=2500546 RepID=A0ABW1R192_9ACTN|nr:Rieske (2Fe-2S) protein [Nocardioides yefusunii]